MERNWSASELSLVNKLISFGKVDDDIYYILLDEHRKNRNMYVADVFEYNIIALNGMNIFEILFELDRFNINYNAMAVENILRCWVIDTLAYEISNINNSIFPYDIIVDAYLSHPRLIDIDLDQYYLDVWGFYTLVENAGIDIITLFTNTLTQLHILRLPRRLRICENKNNINKFQSNYLRV